MGDTTGNFESKINFDMVSIEALRDDDVEFLRGIVERHVTETGSARGQAVLDDFDTEVARFVKIMPNDYKRVLDATALAIAEGRDVDAAVMEASR